MYSDFYLVNKYTSMWVSFLRNQLT